MGDIGNLKTNEEGFAYAAFTDDFLSLFGEKTIIGRSVVITENEDDFGRGDSKEFKLNGNSGKAMASGVIGLTNQFKNLPPYRA